MPQNSLIADKYWQTFFGMGAGMRCDPDAQHPVHHRLGERQDNVPSNGPDIQHEQFLPLGDDNPECAWLEKGSDLEHTARKLNPLYTPMPPEIIAESPMASTCGSAKRWVKN